MPGAAETAPSIRTDEISSTTTLTEYTDHDQSSNQFKLQVGCCKKNKEILRLEHLFNNISVHNILEREATKQRYINALKLTTKRANMYSNFYYSGHFVVTVGSLIVPALLSIQLTSTSQFQQFQDAVYWTTWFLSLMVTISNGILTLFKVDKKYNSLQITLQKLKSEGYQFVALAGRYSGNQAFKRSYDDQLLVFSHQVEKIVQKQADEEYYKATESGVHGITSKSDGTGGEGKQEHAYTIQSPTDTVVETKKENTGQKPEILGKFNEKHLERILSNFILKSKFLDNPMTEQQTVESQNQVVIPPSQSTDIEKGIESPLPPQPPQPPSQPHPSMIPTRKITTTK